MRVVVGRVVRAHGLRGDVLVDARTDDPGLRFGAGSVLLRDGDAPPLTVVAATGRGERWRVRFREVADRDAAEALRGQLLYADSAGLPRRDPDEFHDGDLLGLAVVTTAGEPVGTVADVLHPAQDVLVVRREHGGDALIPFVRALVPQVDLAAGRLVVDAPPGLLDPVGEA